MGNSFRRRVRAAGVAQRFGPDSGHLNAYECGDCGRYMVTVDRAKGKVPTTMPCPFPVRADPALIPLQDPHKIVNDRCDGTARSLGYPQPWPASVPTAPMYEWYRPQGAAEKAARRDPAVALHLDAGGLLFRTFTGVGT